MNIEKLPRKDARRILALSVTHNRELTPHAKPGAKVTPEPIKRDILGLAETITLPTPDATPRSFLAAYGRFTYQGETVKRIGEFRRATFSRWITHCHDCKQPIATLTPIKDATIKAKKLNTDCPNCISRKQRGHKRATTVFFR